MRLINTQTFEFGESYDTDRIRYAIFSHVWREQEVLYADFRNSTRQNKLGHTKLERFCEQAKRDGYDWVWVDTACIDKTSSAELSEAINSMYTWYKDAYVCYVYLDDVNNAEDIPRCRWITRGWTLQELIAPPRVTFYNAQWQILGDKESLAYQLSTWTGIEQVVLQGQTSAQQMSVATRMSWAATRETTRVEDKAYCLLGLFNVNMPLLYGERERAFHRLQEEILKFSNDQSILACDHRFKTLGGTGLKSQRFAFLAADPAAFLGMKIFSDFLPGGGFDLSKTGLKIALDIAPREALQPDAVWGILDCRPEGNLQGQVAIPLLPSEASPENFYLIDRTKANTVINPEEVEIEPEMIIIGVEDSPTYTGPRPVARSACTVELKTKRGLKLHSLHTQNNGVWNPRTLTSEVICDYDTKLLRTFFFKHGDAAFLIRFIDAAMTPCLRRYLTTSRTDHAYLAYAVKPPGTKFAAWMEAQLEHDHKSSTGSRWRGSGAQKSPYHRWIPTKNLQFRCVIDLSAEGCLDTRGRYGTAVIQRRPEASALKGDCSKGERERGGPY